ncbi:hypothetical protein TNCV_2994941 [Trichonephila clavipes]|nr:hypothetical protein TNCV_2994941 [Trichonephila clavipes]
MIGYDITPDDTGDVVSVPLISFEVKNPLVAEHLKPVEFQSPHISMLGKFGEWCTTSFIVIVGSKLGGM